MLKDISVLFGLALLTVLLFRRLKLPTIIGFLVTGILAGPYTFAIIGNPHEVEQMAEIGVVLLLFTIGIEVSLKELMRIKHLLFWGGGLQVGVTLFAVLVAGIVTNYSVQQSIFFGCLAALSSTAIVIKLLIDSGQADSPHGRMAMGILVFQDLCIVPMVLLVPLLAGGSGGITAILPVIVKAAAVVVAAHFGARFLVPWIFEQVVRTRSRELFILSIIFIGIGTAWLTSLAGLSLALGAFIAGLAISESEYSHQALSDIIPFREAFLSLFFISVGMLLDPSVLLKQPLLILSMVCFILIVKSLVAIGAVLALGVSLRIAVITALSLAQIGEFSFVLAGSGVRAGLLTPELFQVFLAASITTMALTPALMKLSGPFSDYLVGMLPVSWVKGRGALAKHKKPLAMQDHMIIVGYGINGRNLARVLEKLQIPFAVIETNPFTVRNEAKRGQRILFGDATNQEVLQSACIDNARGIVVAISDAAASRRVASLGRQLNPALHIIVRTRYMSEVEPLYKSGVNEVVPEEFETSIEILSRVLRNYLVPHEDIESCIAEVRSDGYEMLRSMSKRHSHAVGISGYLAGAELATFRVKPGSILDGEALREGTIRSQSGATVMVIKRGEVIMPNPDPVWELQSDDIVLLLGSAKQLAAASRLFS